MVVTCSTLNECQMYENRDKWRGEYWLQLHKFREGGEKEVLGCPWKPPPLPPSLQALLLSKQPTVFGWPKLFSTLCLTQCDPLLKNPGDTREFITSDYLCVLTVFLNSTSRVVSLPQPGRLHFTINRSQSCIEEVVKDEDDSEIQVYINTNFVFWKLVDTSFLVINGTLWNFALTSVNKCNPRLNYLPNPGSTKTATKISVIFLYVSPTLLSR